MIHGSLDTDPGKNLVNVEKSAISIDTKTSIENIESNNFPTESETSNPSGPKRKSSIADHFTASGSKSLNKSIKPSSPKEEFDVDISELFPNLDEIE